MSAALGLARMAPGFGREVFRVRSATRGDAPAVRIELMQPLASHSDVLTVVGRPLLVPLDRLSELIEAMDHVRREHMEAEDRP